jgi:hypothetical protein
MLRPRYATTFKTITNKILSSEGLSTNEYTKGKNKPNALISFYPFISLSIVDSLISSDTDTVSMNNNLDFLLTQWQY